VSRIVFILGESGSGKSTSLRNLTAKDVSVLSVTGKELPFKTDIAVNTINVPTPIQNYTKVIEWVNAVDKPIMVLDDANYLMSTFEFATLNEGGYDKFARNALGMVNVFNAIREKEGDQTFYIMAHTERRDDGKLSFKTTGKMVADKYNPAGITNIVLEAMFDEDTEEFVFNTKSDGRGIKSPLGMFETDVVPNDLKAVNETISNYYK
jgi:hypothetical protein